MYVKDKMSPLVHSVTVTVNTCVVVSDGVHVYVRTVQQLTSSHFNIICLVVSHKTCSHSTYNWLVLVSVQRQNSPDGVGETETGEIEVAAGSDCGPVEDVTRGRWDGGKEGGWKVGE